MKPITLILLLLTALNCIAQTGTIKGKVSSTNNGTSTPVPFVNFQIEGTSTGCTSDFQGTFEIKNVKPGSYKLIASAVGFEKYTRTVEVKADAATSLQVELKTSELQLNEVVVTGTMKPVFLLESPVKVEVITAQFLRTNPTNNIIEAVQTVNGVQEQINCGVCGTNDIHINGMEGPYTLVLIDGMPIVSALASVYGFNSIPTSLIDRVEIIKGPSSTLYGTEAVGGVINIITKSPANMSRISLNSFFTSHREWNLDLAVAPRIGKKLSTILSTNYYRNQYRMDFNDDNFTDIPLNNRFSLFNKWALQRKDNRVANLALRWYKEDRFGGTMQWQQEDRGSNTVYGESIWTDRLEVIGSYQLPIASEHLRIDYSFNNHVQDSYYGSTSYKAKQQVYFANLIWDKVMGTHNFVIGGTLRYQVYEDNSLADSDQKRFIPGIFAQDEWKIRQRTSLLAGARIDHHHDHGFIVAPRLNVKQKLGDYTTARLNFGTGFRNVHLFTEDHAALTGARRVVIQDRLRPEASYNMTLNLHHTYTLGEGAGAISGDAFYTYFTNKIIPDYEVDPDLIVYDNLTGHSITRGFAVSIDHNFRFPLKMTIGGTFQDVYELSRDDRGNQVKTPQLFTPKFSGTFVIGYKIKPWNVSIDYTGRVMAPQHLPTYPEPFSRAEKSPWYTIQNVQVSKEFKHGLQLYAGVKNLWNWTQASPLIDPQNPFGESFDTSYAWGPLQVRRFFMGVRFNW